MHLPSCNAGTFSFKYSLWKHIMFTHLAHNTQQYLCSFSWNPWWHNNYGCGAYTDAHRSCTCGLWCWYFDLDIVLVHFPPSTQITPLGMCCSYTSLAMVWPEIFLWHKALQTSEVQGWCMWVGHLGYELVAISLQSRHLRSLHHPFGYECCFFGGYWVWGHTMQCSGLIPSSSSLRDHLGWGMKELKEY